MDDIAATQQYFRYLLPDSPIPVYSLYVYIKTNRVAEIG